MNRIYPNVANALPKFFEALEALDVVSDLYPEAGSTIGVLDGGDPVGQFVFTDDELWVFEPATKDKT
jgi:hypothetical protein